MRNLFGFEILGSGDDSSGRTTPRETDVSRCGFALCRSSATTQGSKVFLDHQIPPIRFRFKPFAIDK